MDQGGQCAIKWTQLSRRSFAANAVRLELHALADNLGIFLRTPPTPEPIKEWSLTTLKQKADQDRREGRRPRAHCRVPDGRGRDFDEPVRRDSTNDRLSCGRSRSHQPGGRRQA